MKRRTKIMITLTAVALLFVTIGVQAMPTIIETYIPGQYWGYLPDSVIATMGTREDFVPAVDASTVQNVDAAALLAVASTDNEANRESAAALDGLVLSDQTAPTPLTPPTASDPAPEVEAEPEPEVEVVEEAEPTAVPPTPTPTPEPTPSPTPEPLPVSFRLEGLSGEDNEAQKFNNCGPTNASIILRFYGYDISQLDAAAYLKPNPEDRNVSPWQISDYVNAETALRSITRANGDQELLKRLLVAGYPVVIEKGYQPPESPTASGWYGHYLTLFGYDDEAAEYYTLDTFLGPFAERDVEPGYTLADGFPYSYEYVDEYWEQFAHTFYVIYRPDQEPELFDILGEELLDNQTMWEATARRAQASIEADGENAFAWFNLGTALTRLGELTGENSYYQNGAVAFDKARSIGLPSRMMWYQHRPYIAYLRIGRYQDMFDLAEATLADPGGRHVEETYFWLGQAQSVTGDLNGAAASFERALVLNEFFYPAQIALDYVNSIR